MVFSYRCRASVSVGRSVAASGILHLGSTLGSYQSSTPRMQALPPSISSRPWSSARAWAARFLAARRGEPNVWWASLGWVW